MANEREKDVRASRVLCKSSEHGQIILADQIFSIIAGIAATEVEGVASMADGITRELVARLGMKNLSRGVKTEVLEDQKVSVYMSLNVEFGYSIPEVCSKVQDRVKTMIDSMTGFEVLDVNVKVANVVSDR